MLISLQAINNKKRTYSVRFLLLSMYYFTLPFAQSINIPPVYIRFIMIHHSLRKYFLIIPLHHHQTNHDSPELS